MEDHGWKVKLDHVFPEKWSQNLRPTFRQLLDLLPMVLRALPQQVTKLWTGRKPVIDFLSPTTGQNIYGVPLGGIGCGTIGRGFKGEFCRYQLKPGLYEYRTVEANQFILNVRDEGGQTLYQQVLSPVRKPERHLSTWKWDFPGHRGSYRGLYPRSWTDYEIPEQQLRLQCRQVSPVIPHNYRDSSLPVAVFVWTVENLGDRARNVSITFTFKNGDGTAEDNKGGCWCEAFEEGPAVGSLLAQDLGGVKCVYGVAGLRKDGVEVSRLLTFDPRSDGGRLWGALEAEGHLDAEVEARSAPAEKGRQLATAVCLRALVPPSGGRRVLEVALAWDMPTVFFAGRRREYRRFYTRFFGAGGDAAPRLCAHALRSYGGWEADIEAWQRPVLEDPDLPSWYKSALFNELYFVSDGGSVWLDDDGDKEGVGVGLFAYLEGHEYRMYNTYDVHFYASFALAQLWPRLQLSVQRLALEAFAREDAAPRKHLYAGHVAPRKVKGSMPHDVGDPEEDPFLLLNAYPIHDVSEWRDLNLKFVLQTFRDHAVIGDGEAEAFLREAWPTVKAIVARGLRWDEDGDGLIENSGGPDQTFDTWVMTGPSAYCGGLWVAALYCAARMAETVGDHEAQEEYRQLLGRAQKALQDKLWNGEYYNFDATSDSIMADQLCGHWYLRASGVTEEVFPRENVLSALRKIYEFNVLRFRDGTMGAVNGMLPSGAVDGATLQSEEVWTGVTYALAALMVHEGLVEEGLRTAEGVYRTVWERVGQGYETPEALLVRGGGGGGGVYRSVGYMRPLSVWAVQLAWSRR